MISLTHAFSLDGRMRISSPTAMVPVSICPWNPLKLLFGRHTLCIGIVKPASASSADTSMSSRYSRSDLPSYQRVLSDLSVTLSPSVADTGMTARLSYSNSLISTFISAKMSLNLSSSNAIRSILFTAKTK